MSASSSSSSLSISSLCSASLPTSASVPKKGLQLDYDKIRGEAKADRQKEEDKALGPEIKVVFELSNGSTYESNFRVGWTVGYLKFAIEQKCAIPYHLQELYYNEKIMSDPLSLRDYPIKMSEVLKIRVKVLKEEEAAKMAKDEASDE